MKIPRHKPTIKGKPTHRTAYTVPVFKVDSPDVNGTVMQLLAMRLT